MFVFFLLTLTFFSVAAFRAGHIRLVMLVKGEAQINKDVKGLQGKVIDATWSGGRRQLKSAVATLKKVNEMSHLKGTLLVAAIDAQRADMIGFTKEDPDSLERHLSFIKASTLIKTTRTSTMWKIKIFKMTLDNNGKHDGDDNAL